jgi:nitrate reductase (NAD(P)H)
MGMLNNPWFTVVKHFEAGPAGPRLRFEHPTLAGAAKGGWMTPEARRLPGAVLSPETRGFLAEQDTHAARAAAVAALAPPEEKKEEKPKLVTKDSTVLPNVYTLADLEKHDTPQDCWIAIKGVVYDVNRYLVDHPGGASSITMNAGQDCTDEFTAIHSQKAWAQLDQFAIGTLASADAVAEEKAESDTKVTLDRKKRISLTLAARDQLSPDSFRLRFALPSPEHVLGLPVGKHVLVYGQDAAGKMVARAYTPATADEVLGHVDFVIKAYRPLPPRFPDGGALSQYLCDRIPVGSTVEFRGPMGEIEYLGNQRFEAHDKEAKLKHFVCAEAGLIAGGTGLTPMLQLITAAQRELGEGAATTKYSLLLGNRTEGDILCREELELAAKAGAVDLHFTLDKPPENWPYFSGFVDAPMLEKTMPKPGPDAYVFCCGPPPMIKSAVAKLQELGHAADHIFCF